MACGMRKRGNMLPPTEDIIRITSVESGPSCARVWHRLASNMPKAPTAKAVERPMTENPSMCGTKSSLKTSHAHRNISTS